VLTNAQGFFEFLLQHLVEVNESGTDKGRVAIVRAMGEALAKTGNSVLIDTHAQRTAQRLGVSAEAVRMEFRKAGNRAVDTTSPEAAKPQVAAAPATRPGTAEFWLIKFLLQADHDLLVWANQHLDPNWVIHPTARRIIEARFLDTTLDDPKDIAYTLKNLEGDTFACQLVTEAANERREIPNLQQQITDTTRRVRDLWIDRQIGSLNARIGDPALTDEQRLAALRNQQELRAWKRQPLATLGDS
jgi:DNA primase